MTDIRYIFSPFDFGEILRTKEEAATFIDMLDHVLDTFFNAKQDAAQKMKQLLPYHIYNYIELLATKQGVLLENKPMLKNFLVQMQTYIKTIPVITIELAFRPTENMLVNISNYISTYIKRAILFEIIVNKDVIAGCKLNFNGHYKDLSIKNKLDEAIRHETIELMQRI